MTYEEKLLHPRWQKKRLEIFNRDKFSCVCCKDKGTTLHVHHTLYIDGYEPWDYPNHTLFTYCERCHNSEHLIGNQIQDYLIELIKEKPLFIKQLAQACILIEDHPPFINTFREFMKQEMYSYLKTKDNG